MDINIIGAGNVAWHLAHRLYECGYTIKTVYSRTEKNAEALAQQVKAMAINNIAKLPPADIHILSLKDEVYVDIIAQMQHTEAVYVHTSGCMNAEILSKLSENYGVLYPFQTFNKAKQVDFSAVPVCVEASNAHTLQMLQSIAENIGNFAYNLNMQQRLHLHLAGVIASNFTNALYGLAKEILDKENISFDIIKPLIKETAAKVDYLHPYDAQTGPASRKDWNIINKQIAMLDNDHQRNLYRYLTQTIQEQQSKREHEEL
ncbi:MAG: DUF2520 domain-containing protein [Bacteroidales bacterium]|nr:DUF2520 domain-containing protein [Bacteroidales bacterium]